jgi:hypothetical protein
MDEESKTPPQIALPKDLHKILKQRSRDTNISMQRLVADALRVGMKIKQWLPEEVGN